MLFGAIEAGGTKFKVAIGDEDGNIIEQKSFPTTTPNETMKEVFSFFDGKEIQALGIGSFGPINLNKDNETYGYITNTPKPFWGNFDFVGTLKKRYPKLIIGFDTDVNVAALAELKKGAGVNVNNLVYLTIGTGVGGGLVVNGELVHGLLHPEVGHMRLVKHPEDNFKGTCPFHDNCLEGLACGPSIEARWGIKGIDIPNNHVAWDYEAYYLGQAISNLILILSCEKVILGGGVMHQEQLLGKIRREVLKNLNNYIQDERINNIEQMIVKPVLKDDCGLVGSLLLAKDSYEKEYNN